MSVTLFSFSFGSRASLSAGRNDIFDDSACGIAALSGSRSAIDFGCGRGPAGLTGASAITGAGWGGGADSVWHSAHPGDHCLAGFLLDLADTILELQAMCGDVASRQRRVDGAQLPTRAARAFS